MNQSDQIIPKYFPELTTEQTSQFAQLMELYMEWNAKINVISRKDIENLYINHVLHSLGIACVIRFKKKTKVMDAGTGGGFPGIPLAILFPEVQFHLVDSIGKKIRVVSEIVNALGLKNVIATQNRVEELDEKFHFIVSRAVTSLPDFYKLVKPLILNQGFNILHNGILYLKGGDVAEEIRLLRKQAMVFDLKDYFREEFFETKKVVYIPV